MQFSITMLVMAMSVMPQFGVSVIHHLSIELLWLFPIWRSNKLLPVFIILNSLMHIYLCIRKPAVTSISLQNGPSNVLNKFQITWSASMERALSVCSTPKLAKLIQIASVGTIRRLVAHALAPRSQSILVQLTLMVPPHRLFGSASPRACNMRVLKTRTPRICLDLRKCSPTALQLPTPSCPLPII